MISAFLVEEIALFWSCQFHSPRGHLISTISLMNLTGARIYNTPSQTLYPSPAPSPPPPCQPVTSYCRLSKVKATGLTLCTPPPPPLQTHTPVWACRMLGRGATSGGCHRKTVSETTTVLPLNQLSWKRLSWRYNCVGFGPAVKRAKLKKKKTEYWRNASLA